MNTKTRPLESADQFHPTVWRFMRQAVELGSGSYHSDHRHRLLSLMKSEFLRPAGSAHVKGYCRVWVWTAFFFAVMSRNS